MKIMTDKPSTKGIMVLAISLVAWISVTAAFIGIRPEHIGLGCFIAVLFLISRATRKLVVALLSLRYLEFLMTGCELYPIMR